MVSEQLSLAARIALRITMVYWDQMPGRFITVQTVYSFPLKCRLCLFLCLSLLHLLYSLLQSPSSIILFSNFKMNLLRFLFFVKIESLEALWLYRGLRVAMASMYLIKVLGTLSPWLATWGGGGGGVQDHLCGLQKRVHIWNFLLWAITNTLAIIIYNLELCKSKDNLPLAIGFTWIKRDIIYFIAKFYVKHSTEQVSLHTVYQLSRKYRHETAENMII